MARRRALDALEGVGRDWPAVPEPMRDWKTWGVPELKNHDGMVWFRRSVTLTAQQAAAAATLNLGAIDEVDETWVNGRPIANSFGYATARPMRCPPGCCAPARTPSWSTC